MKEEIIPPEKPRSRRSRAGQNLSPSGATFGGANTASRYDPLFCRGIMKAASEGKSETYWAVMVCGVTRATMRAWRETHPEFKEAFMMAKNLEMLWWEEKGQRSLTRMGFNTALYNKIVSSRFAKYNDKVVVEGDEDKPITHVHTVRRVIVKSGAKK